MKNLNRNQLAVWAFCLVLGFFMSGCSSQLGNRVDVMIELPAANIVDFSQYDTVLYKDITLESIPEGVKPLEEINTFFLQDLGRTVDKKIEPWDKEKHGTTMPVKCLLISGNLKIEIKSRSKIENIKEDGKNKGKKGFVTVQHWEMVLSIVFTDATSNKDIFKQDFKAKLANVESDSPKYNFENLFFKVTGEFLKRVTRTKKMQRRYILL
jgi:hypothetical protein